MVAGLRKPAQSQRHTHAARMCWLAWMRMSRGGSLQAWVNVGVQVNFVRNLLLSLTPSLLHWQVLPLHIFRADPREMVDDQDRGLTGVRGSSLHQTLIDQAWVMRAPLPQQLGGLVSPAKQNGQKGQTTEGPQERLGFNFWRKA